ncbi:hypothetical protein EGW08_004849 [Elysia chlorotica]|uniref:VDE lipocalin domain-containing protein n=1 Tax=Elysia chlorotica TaxID=188477 RepID=A0A433U0T5_ELYCH|nr:hypothetical protein EGW08_004849 [Elysia chlorotica]
MNTFTATLAVVAMLVFSTSATPCSDICAAECALSLQACQFSGALGDLCATENTICTKDCDASCFCVDSCAEKCGTAFAACKGDGVDLLKLESCTFNFEACEAQCGTQCEMQAYNDALKAVIPGA